MANKRMFSKDIVDSDYFYDLPFTSQLLYFHLGIHADIKGFVQPKKIIRTVGLKLEDIKPLIEKNFVIPFESGVVVITHWKLNNQLREDREKPTLFQKELSLLAQHNDVYELLPDNSRSTPAQVRLGKVRLGEIRNIHTQVPAEPGSATYRKFVDTLNTLKGSKYRYNDKKAQRQFDARLKEGFTLEDFEVAITNCLKDDYHRQNPHFLTPEFITRTDKLAKYMNYQQKAKSASILAKYMKAEEVAHET